MKIHAWLVAGLLAMPMAASAAAEQYMCYRVSDKDGGTYKQDVSEYVALSVDRDAIETRIHIKAASKDLTFRTCKPLTADGSNFATWFKTECRDLKAKDGLSYTIEPFLAGAYAGISPVIDERYAVYKAIQSASQQAGMKLPERTFAIYADRKPLYEFFCTRLETPRKP
ncbi:MAG TPA: hypothetical protein VII92_09200 [Anaerolineae bacterium]